MIAVRTQLTDRDPQPTLFPTGRDVYHASVTNLDLEPEHVWRCYNDRAGLAGLVKALPDDDGLGHIPTQRFAANALSLAILRLADHLVVGFQTLCVPEHWHHATLGTIRRHVFLLPAVLATPQGRPVLRCPASSPTRRDCDAAMNALKSLNVDSVW